MFPLSRIQNAFKRRFLLVTLGVPLILVVLVKETIAGWSYFWREVKDTFKVAWRGY